MPGERTDLRWDRARHAGCPERSTEDTWLHLGVLIGTIQRHECQNDDLRLVFKEFPILGPESTLAARAALASRAQSLYEPFRWALLGADGPFDLDHILGVARRCVRSLRSVPRGGTPALPCFRNGMFANNVPVEPLAKL